MRRRAYRHFGGDRASLGGTGPGRTRWRLFASRWRSGKGGVVDLASTPLLPQPNDRPMNPVFAIPPRGPDVRAEVELMAAQFRAEQACGSAGQRQDWLAAGTAHFSGFSVKGLTARQSGFVESVYVGLRFHCRPAPRVRNPHRVRRPARFLPAAPRLELKMFCSTSACTTIRQAIRSTLVL
jgi:hypothetical protein